MDSQLFSEVYVIGGSPCSGKSTVAERLTKESGLAYYKVDDHEQAHAARCERDRHPVMFSFGKMSWNEIWSRPAEVQADEEIEFYRERFEMIVHDLEHSFLSRPILTEGAAYLPELMWRCGVSLQRVIFLIPTREFQITRYRERPWIHQILENCENPDKAFDDWMARDHLFGQEVLRQAKTHGYETAIVDGSLRPDELHAKVKDHFGIGFQAAGPR